MCFGVIYKATNIITNKCYIGQAIGFNRRKKNIKLGFQKENVIFIIL
jgi:hypothetical protein